MTQQQTATEIKCEVQKYNIVYPGEFVGEDAPCTAALVMVEISVLAPEFMKISITLFVAGAQTVEKLQQI